MKVLVAYSSKRGGRRRLISDPCLAVCRVVRASRQGVTAAATTRMAWTSALLHLQQSVGII
jgi:hypothetical protein